MLRHSAHVLPRIGNFHHTVGLGLLEGLQQKYGDLVRLAKASRARPVLYVFHPDAMREVSEIKKILPAGPTLFYRPSVVTLRLPYIKPKTELRGEHYHAELEVIATTLSHEETTRKMRLKPVYESGTTEAPRWEKSPLAQHRKSKPGLCPMHGDESKAVWSAIRELMQEDTLLKNFNKAFDDIATDITRRLSDLRHAENSLNEEIETEIYRWALETVGLIMFGIRLGCLDGAVHIPTHENRKHDKTSMDDDTPDLCSLSKRALEELTPAEQLVRCTRDIADGCYLVRSENTLKNDSQTFNNALKTFDIHLSLTDHFLQQALEQLDSKNPKLEQVLLDKLRPLDRRILPLASDVFLAGVDPLAQTALSMLYQLSLHAAQQQRAHDEVHWAAASIDVGATCPHMPYISACAKEAMRLHPATGGVVRRSKERIVVGGYEVPAGVDIVLAHGVTSKLEKEWGRGKAFIPERWCSEVWDPLKASRAHHLAFMPFGETCPATGMVGRTLAALATRVLDKYRLEWHGPLPNIVTTGVNRMQPPYYFVLQNAA